MLLKIAFQKEIHLYKGDSHFNTLKKHCQNVFKTLPNSFEFYYLDSDQDEISISSQQDLDIITNPEETPSIKKIFIKETEQEFEILENLTDLANPEEEEILTKENYCKLKDTPKNYAKDIKVINIFEETLKKREDELYAEEVNKYLAGIENSLIRNIIKEEEKTIQEETCFYLGDLTNIIINQLNREDESQVKEEVYKYMDFIMDDCATKIVKDDEIKRQQREREEQKTIFKTDSDLINKLLDEKISKLLPSLIQRVTKAVEDRISIDGCTKCKKKQTELDFQDLIRAELMKKVQTKPKLYEI